MALSSAIWQQYFPDGRMNRASGLWHDTSGAPTLDLRVCHPVAYACDERLTPAQSLEGCTEMVGLEE